MTNPKLNSHLNGDAGVAQVGELPDMPIDRLATLCSEWPNWLHGEVTDAIDLSDKKDWSTEQVVGYAILSTLSRRAANTTGTVKVKALSWRYYPENNIGAAEWLAAQSINGQYFRVGRVTDGWRYGGTFYDDIEAAKAAAQTDFNQRILSSLEPASSVEGQEPVAWRWSEADGDTGGVTDRQDIADYAKVQGWAVEPLYTRPSPAVSAEVTQLIDACQNVYDKLAGETTTVTIFDQERLGDALAALREPQP